MMSPVRGIYVVTYMPVILHAPALTVPVTDLSDFLFLIVNCDPPDLFMAKSKLPVQYADMDWNQINLSV